MSFLSTPWIEFNPQSDISSNTCASMLLASKYDQVSMFINDQSNSWLVQITFCLVINAFVWNTHSIIVLPPRTHKQYRTHKLAYPGDDIRGCALTLWFWLLILANSNLWKGDIQKVPGETTYALIVVVVVCCPCWVAASTIPKQQHASFSAFFSYLNLSHWKLLDHFLYKKEMERNEGMARGRCFIIFGD